jgi:hypothetical protein
MPTTKPGHGSGIGKNADEFKPGNLDHHQDEFSNPAGWVGLAGIQLIKDSKGVDVDPPRTMGSIVPSKSRPYVRKGFGSVGGSE